MMRSLERTWKNKQQQQPDDVEASYLHLTTVVGNDEAKQDDRGETDDRLQG